MNLVKVLMVKLMKIIDLVEDLDMPVEFYAKALYNWDRHDAEQKQTKADVNKTGGFIKTFSDEFGNQAFVMHSTSVPIVPERFYYEATEKTYDGMQQLIKEDFYFCATLKAGHGYDELEFPNEIFKNLDDAVAGAGKFLSEM